MNHGAKLIFLGLFSLARDSEPEMAAIVNGTWAAAERPPVLPCTPGLGLGSHFLSIILGLWTQNLLLLRKHSEQL